MAVKIRLQRHGAKKRPFYYIVAAHSTNTRDGKFIEKLGTYNPLTVPATINIDRTRALYWLHEGAIPTTTVHGILSFKGVLYLKHLMRGVKLGLFDEPTALDKFEKWNATHEETVSNRREHHKKTKAATKAAQYVPVVKKVEEVVAPVAETTTEEPTSAAETEAPAAEATPKATDEAAPEAAAEATPEAEA